MKISFGSAFWAAVSSICLAVSAVYSIGYAAAMNPLTRLLVWLDYLAIALSGARVGIFCALVVAAASAISVWARCEQLPPPAPLFPPASGARPKRRTPAGTWLGPFLPPWPVVLGVAFLIAALGIWLLLSRMFLAGNDDTPEYYEITAKLLLWTLGILATGAVVLGLVLRKGASLAIYVGCGTGMALAIAFLAGDTKSRHDQIRRPCAAIDIVFEKDRKATAQPAAPADKSASVPKAADEAASELLTVEKEYRNIVLVSDHRIYTAGEGGLGYTQVPSGATIEIDGKFCRTKGKPSCCPNAIDGYCPSMGRKFLPFARCVGRQCRSPLDLEYWTRPKSKPFEEPVREGETCKLEDALPGAGTALQSPLEKYRPRQPLQSPKPEAPAAAPPAVKAAAE